MYVHIAYHNGMSSAEINRFTLDFILKVITSCSISHFI